MIAIGGYEKHRNFESNEKRIAYDNKIYNIYLYDRIIFVLLLTNG